MWFGFAYPTPPESRPRQWSVAYDDCSRSLDACELTVIGCPLNRAVA